MCLVAQAVSPCTAWHVQLWATWVRIPAAPRFFFVLHGCEITMIYLSSLRFHFKYQQDWWRKPLVHWSVNCGSFRLGRPGSIPAPDTQGHDSCTLRQWLGDRHVSPPKV